MFATQVLPENVSDVEEEEVVEVVGFIVVDNMKHEVKRGETKIGRDSSMCSIVIENDTVSKIHAVIESDGMDDTFIYDVGSTNQTRLGRKVLKPHCRYKLENESIITLGSIIVKFIIPPCKSEGVTPSISDEGNLNELNEFGDIFDIATQAVAPDSGNSSKVLAFMNQSKDFQTFNGTNTKARETTDLPKNIFDLVTQGVLSPHERTSESENHKSSGESSGIFSSSTPCKINRPQMVTKNESNSNTECKDELNSWLNDGEDDKLFAVTSLCSPNELDGNDRVKRTTAATDTLTQVLDAPTQIPAVIESTKERGMEPKSSPQEFLASNSSKSTFESISVDSRLKSNVSQNNYTKQTEDFIKTQEFKMNESHRECLPENLSEDEETQAYLKETLTDAFITESKHDDEDLILTQTFETSERNQVAGPAVVIPESEDIGEDFSETQIYDVEKEKNAVIMPFRAPESPDENVVFTQRNNEDDFIATQAFGVPEAVSVIESSDRDDNSHEDFIQTQVVEFPEKKITKFKEERMEVESQERSPDLLTLGSSYKDSEDCIGTQIFEPVEYQNSKTTFSGFSEKFNLLFSSNPREEDPDTIKEKAPETSENSGDDTESDLEIIYCKNEIKREDQKNTESCYKNEFQLSQNHKRSRSSESQNSNDSYVFEIRTEDNLEEIQTEKNKRPHSDSSTTDCEEIAAFSPKIVIKQELPKAVEFEDTQVLTLTRPDNFSPVGSPKFEFGNDNEPWSPLSLEMPSTQDMESSMKKIKKDGSERNDKTGPDNCEDFQPSTSRVQKIEVGNENSNGESTFWNSEPSEMKVHSPKKRPLESVDVQVVPPKKSKFEDSSEKQFSRLVQAHDISQIRPSRTRSSMKNFKPENKTETPTGSSTNKTRENSRRTNTKRGRSITKTLNCDITPYLIKRREGSSGGGRKNERPVPKKETRERSTRVLRSSVSNSLSPNSPFKPSESRRKQPNSRTVKNDYFASPRVYVAFTGFDSASLDNIIEDLGGKKTSDLSRGEVVVANKVRRTVKFLCAVGLSLPITSPQWLLSCKKERKFLNPWNFILKDEESENKWDFELKTSLERSKKVKLFQGFSFFATKSTKPPVKDLLTIVECCGGTPIFEPPKIWPRKTIIVSCLQDKNFWPAAKLRNVQIVHYEFILSGVLRQKIDFKTHKLR